MIRRAIDRRVFIKKSAGAGVAAMLIPGSALVFESCNNDQSAFTKIDWREMLRSHDILWKVLPKDMTEAPHFGNGLIGSMIWIENNEIRLQIFRPDVHDHADHTYGWSAFSRPRYQIGYFTIKPKGEIIDCDLRQDIYNAELNGVINTDLGSLKIDHFVHRHDDVIYTEIESSDDEELSDFQWHPFEAKGSRGGDPGGKGYGQAYAPYKKMKNAEHQIAEYEDISVSVQDLSAGGNYATAWKEGRSSNNRINLLLTIQNSYPEKTSVEDAIKVINNAREKIEKGLKSWRFDHRSWWHSYFPESYVSIPDPVGQSFYWNNVYRLACCTRPDAQYIDTPGMWNSGGPWPYSTHDFNTQTVHFPVYSANRLHLGEALVNALKRNKDNLINNVVPVEWQDDSALLNLATAFDMKGKRDGDGRYKEMLGCLPWLLNNVWFQYRYTMDTEILKDPLFPLLRRSVNLYRHILYKGDDGRLHLPPTFSPELGNFNDCNFDLALLKWGCATLIEICGILKIEDPLMEEWERILDQIVDFSLDEKGYMLGKERSAPIDHQHMSHLIMIYPLYIENIDNNDNIDLLEKSVKNFRPPTALPKMAASQSSPAAAALGLGNLAHELMNDILYSNRENEKLGINGIYYLATPCIETSLSYNTCVQDMLIQSWGNKIRIFPALPDSWDDVEFHNFRTEGAFLVSAKRTAGKIVWVKIKSLAGEACIVQLSKDGDSIKLDIKKGEEIVL